jgi:hypothetical protein
LVRSEGGEDACNFNKLPRWAKGEVHFPPGQAPSEATGLGYVRHYDFDQRSAVKLWPGDRVPARRIEAAFTHDRWGDMWDGRLADDFQFQEFLEPGRAGEELVLFGKAGAEIPTKGTLALLMRKACLDPLRQRVHATTAMLPPGVKVRSCLPNSAKFCREPRSVMKPPYSKIEPFSSQ